MVPPLTNKRRRKTHCQTGSHHKKTTTILHILWQWRNKAVRHSSVILPHYKCRHQEHFGGENLHSDQIWRHPYLNRGRLFEVDTFAQSRRVPDLHRLLLIRLDRAADLQGNGRLFTLRVGRIWRNRRGMCVIEFSSTLLLTSPWVREKGQLRFPHFFIWVIKCKSLWHMANTAPHWLAKPSDGNNLS